MKYQFFKKEIKRTATCLTLVLLLACQQNSPFNESIQDNSVKNGEKETSSASNLNEPKNLKIIKSAKGRYKVKNVKISTLKIKSFAAQFEGYISGLQYQNNRHNIENNFRIKVPQKNFDTLLDSINGYVDFVEFENITTKDVTEEYIDVETRLKTKKEIKQRYESILRKKAKTVKDILLAETKIGNIQEEIESAQGRLQYLQNRVSYSTIQVELYEPVEYIDTSEINAKSFSTKVKESFSNGLDIVSNFLLLVINIWPLIVIGLSIFLFIRKKKINIQKKS